MELNSIVFPSPSFDKDKITPFLNELIYIPVNKNNNKYDENNDNSDSSDNEKNNSENIPCIFLPERGVSPSKNFIIMFHGNAEDIFNARAVGEELKNTLHMNVIIPEYPSYSIYEGKADAEKILSNTLIIYDFIKKTFEIDDNNIFIFGRSIGTSPATYLSSKRYPNALILVSAFTSIKAVANNLVGFLDFLLKDRLYNIDYIKNVKCPTLFIHGQSDTLIPFTETLKLKDNFSGPYEVILPLEMTHNEYDIEEDIMENIKMFFKRHCIIDEEKNNFQEKADLLKYIYETPDNIKKLLKE